ncbi:MFS transporter [Ferruginivarius sediminum]|nr:MFS transporter [Ferruginivarius sediminum]
MAQEGIYTDVHPRKQWAALFVAVLSIVAAGSFTTLAGLLSTNFESEFGWTASAMSLGIGVNMALYGLTAPFAIFAMQKYGIRRVSVIALCILIAGSAVCLIPNLALFNFSWGLLVGLGTGTLTMAYGALVARTWFGGRQGTVTGIVTAAAVVGQFALLPLWAEAADMFGWRAPLIGSAVLAGLAIVANIALMGDERKYAPNAVPAAEVEKRRFVDVFHVVYEAVRSRPFWTLAFLFAICGATTNGVMWSHFTPAVCGVGMSATAASSVLFLIGVFNVVGTMASGWLTDRISPRMILAFVFFARAGTLFWLPLIISSDFDPQIVTFGILFGILDVATVPPVIALCNRAFGDNGPAVFGWVNAVHQVGAGAMAFSGGLIRTNFGSYDPMWIATGVLCVIAAVMVYSSRYPAYRPAQAASSA